MRAWPIISARTRTQVHLAKRCGTMDLLGRLLAEPAFDILRTKEQLGYSVSVRPLFGVAPAHYYSRTSSIELLGSSFEATCC